MSLPHRSPLSVIRVSGRGHFSVTKLLPKLLQFVLWIDYVLDVTQTRKAKPEMKTVTMITTKRELLEEIKEMNRVFSHGDAAELVEVMNRLTFLADKLRYETEEYAEMIGAI